MNARTAPTVIELPAPVAIDRVELIRVRLPLVIPFETIHGILENREVLLVHVVGPHTEGWGECSALPTIGYAREDLDGAHRAVRDVFAPLLVGDTDVAADRLPDEPRHPMARAAIEMALLDAQLRPTGFSLRTLLGADAETAPAGATLGLGGGSAALADQAEQAVADGYLRLKCKIEPGRDADRLEAVRERVGSDVELAADANGTYASANAVPRVLDELSLQCLEQPLAADDLPGLAKLTRERSTLVALDETATSVATAEAALDADSGNAVVLKAARLGGVLEAYRLHDLCRGRGIPLIPGGLLESGVGRAAALAVAALPGCTLTGDLAASDRYFAEDVTEPFVLDDGHLRVPDGPGLGVTPRADVLAAHTVATETVRA